MCLYLSPDIIAFYIQDPGNLSDVKRSTGHNIVAQVGKVFQVCPDHKGLSFEEKGDGCEGYIEVFY